MKKIAIVGVEGSGKTVLMAAMGDKYKSPDANGIYLKPVNRETFAYCEKLMGQMQDGKWPIATGKAITDNLRWTLTRKVADGEDDRIAELSFLDFGGEIYRLAFGGGEHDEPDEDTKNAIAQLRSHVEEAEVLIVLVNLSDIINGKRNEERTIEMNWLSQAILSFAYDEANKSSVALVFTQADLYAETIADCGGLRGVLTKYMPTVDTSYGKRLALFSVAAVNKTVPAPDGSGFQVPSPDFKPQGLENLVSWVVNYVVEVRRRNEQRVTQAVEAEESKRKRWKIAVGVIGLLGILGLGAWIGYNTNTEFKNWVDGQLTAIGWAQKETAVHTEPRPAVPLVKPAEEPRKLPVEPAKPPKAEPKWIVGARNPNNPNLVAGKRRNTWVATRPGYVWIEGTDRDEWKQGLRHPDNSKLVSDWQEGEWKSTEEGYVWVGGSRTEWRAGIESSKHPHWVSIITDEHPTDYWRPKPGYSKKDKNAEGLSELVWTPGLMDGERKASTTPEQWLHKCGSCSGTGRIKRSTKCSSCDGKGTIRTRETCSDCDGSGKVKTLANGKCPVCSQQRERINALLGGVWPAGKILCPKMLEPNFAIRNLGTFNGQFLGLKHVFLKGACFGCGGSGKFLSPMGPVNCVTCGGYGYIWELCKTCSGEGVRDCDTCGGDGEIRRTEESSCDNCDGDGWRYRSKQCGDCKGEGVDLSTSRCGTCNGDGWIAE